MRSMQTCFVRVHSLFSMQVLFHGVPGKLTTVQISGWLQLSELFANVVMAYMICHVQS